MSFLDFNFLSFFTVLIGLCGSLFIPIQFFFVYMYLPGCSSFSLFAYVSIGLLIHLLLTGVAGVWVPYRLQGTVLVFIQQVLMGLCAKLTPWLETCCKSSKLLLRQYLQFVFRQVYNIFFFIVLMPYSNAVLCWLFNVGMVVYFSHYLLICYTLRD